MTGNQINMEPFRIEEGVVFYCQSIVYYINKILGSGTFGKVALCIRQDTGETVAVKFVKEQLYNQVVTETNTLENLKQIDPDQNNLVKYFGCFYFRKYYCLVFELLDSSLCEVMRERYYTPVKVSYIRLIAQQMLVALSSLKQLGVTHADIKPDNIMVVDRISYLLKFKLIDFGLASPTYNLSVFDNIQNAAYRAPEVYLGLPRDEAVDMWALGCTLAFMFLGNHLFSINSEYEALRVMLQLLGMPNKGSMEKGWQVPHFFTQEQIGSEMTWRLKTKEEFEKETGTFIEESYSIFDGLHCLDDLLRLVPEIQDQTELEDAKAFIDLLKQMLAINPEDRILPDDALKHRFITMEHIANNYVREAYAIMTGCQFTDPDSVSVVSDNKNTSDEPESDREVAYVKRTYKVMTGCQPIKPHTFTIVSDSKNASDEPESASNNQQQGSQDMYAEDPDPEPNVSENLMEMPLTLERGLSIRDQSTVYHVEKALGSGTFGKVAMCTKEDTGETVALKFVKKEDYREVETEKNTLEFLKQLDPQENHLIKFFNCFEHGDYYCFVFELLHTSLWDMMEQRQFRPLRVSNIRVLAQQMLVALSALKRLGVAHTDIKPDNIMCIDGNSKRLQFKLIDFGLAAMATNLSENSIIQNESYRAPEVYLGLPRDEGIDMFALGCTLAFMFLGCDLFAADNEYENLRLMLKLLGTPSKDSLDKGWQVPHFFTQEQMGSEHMWRLKTREEFEEDTGTIIERIHPEFEELHSIDDLLTWFPKIEDPTKSEDTQAFIDLLKKMLAINPEDRILPEDALNHRFITMTHFTDREKAYVKRTNKVMTGCQPIKPETFNIVNDSKNASDEPATDKEKAYVKRTYKVMTGCQPIKPETFNIVSDSKNASDEPATDKEKAYVKRTYKVMTGCQPIQPETFSIVSDKKTTSDETASNIQMQPKSVEEPTEDSSHATKAKKKPFRRVRKFFSQVFRSILSLQP